MKKIKNFFGEYFIEKAAWLAKWLCYFAVGFFVMGVFLSFAGRQSFILHSHEGMFENVRLIDERTDWAHGRGISTGVPRELRVFTASGTNEIEFATRAALSVAYLFSAVPMGISFLFLGLLFRNINRGEIFAEKNADLLLYFALLQFVGFVISPILVHPFFRIANSFTSSRITALTDLHIFNVVFALTAIITASVIIRKGVRLQEEVDATV
jgi:hypothetical protein